jgi:hypothetical protein
MDAKQEITRILKDVQASAREFAQLGLSTGVRALEYTGGRLKSLEENLKRTAEKLKQNGHDAPAAEEKPADPTQH